MSKIEDNIQVIIEEAVQSHMDAYRYKTEAGLYVYYTEKIVAEVDELLLKLDKVKVECYRCRGSGKEPAWGSPHLFKIKANCRFCKDGFIETPVTLKRLEEME